MNCVTENDLRAYHDGELDAAARQEIEAHLASCAPCASRFGKWRRRRSACRGVFRRWMPERRTQL